MLADSPAVRLRIGDVIYRGRARRVEDQAEIGAYLSALRHNYKASAATLEDFGPGNAWLFRIDPK